MELSTSCATAQYVNGIVETGTREPMSLWSFCRGQAELTDDKPKTLKVNFSIVYISLL